MSWLAKCRYVFFAAQAVFDPVTSTVDYSSILTGGSAYIPAFPLVKAIFRANICSIGHIVGTFWAQLPRHAPAPELSRSGRATARSRQPFGISKPRTMTAFDSTDSCRMPITAWYSGELYQRR